MNILLKERLDKKEIQSNMYGLFFEDINYGLDGGLYAEMLENRHFEFLECRGKKYAYYQRPAYQYGWNAYPDKESSDLTLHDEQPLNEINPHYLCADIKIAGAGFSNKAYDGIYMEAGSCCRVSFYARTNEAEAETVQICVLSPGGDMLCESCKISIGTREWTRYETELIAETEIEAGLFTILFDKAAKICFDQFSMMPEDAVYGLFRRDLAELLKELKPGFLRFPGGCVVEGNDLANRYQWKLTVGLKEERKSNWNRWAVHGNDHSEEDISTFPYYNQTLGIGYFEYFLLCEYLECEPLPVINVGLACQYQSKELVKTDAPEFFELIQDALDLIEFANGPVDTKWGGLRAQMGHPDSFHLSILGIGNEQWETDSVDFFHRYELFEESLHEIYPEIKCIGSAGPDVGSERYQKAWEHFSPRMKENKNYAYAVDEHYYVSDCWLYEHVHMYDSYPRENKVFAGEYACHIHPEEIPEKRNSFASALAEAAFITGLEKNSDVVLMASYAPLLARIGYNQWQPDLIWFNAKHAYGSPNYYVQQMYSCFTGDEVLDVTGTDTEREHVYITASKSKKNCTVYVKIINAGEVQQELIIGSISNETDGVLWTLAGNLSDCNSIEAPKKIAPKEQKIDVSRPIIILPHSISVLIF